MAATPPDSVPVVVTTPPPIVVTTPPPPATYPVVDVTPPPAVVVPAPAPVPVYAPAPAPVPVYAPPPAPIPGGVPPPGTTAALYAAPGTGKTWTNGLFSCFEDPGLCCLTCWCPCITSGRISEILDKGGNFSCPMGGLIYFAMASLGLNSCYTCIWRTKMRETYNINPHQTNFTDFCIHLWCEGCALCQEYRELQAMGIEPALGWQGYLATSAPQVQQEMVRV